MKKLAVVFVLTISLLLCSSCNSVVNLNKQTVDTEREESAQVSTSSEATKSESSTAEEIGSATQIASTSSEEADSSPRTAAELSSEGTEASSSTAEELSSEGTDSSPRTAEVLSSEEAEASSSTAEELSSEGTEVSSSIAEDVSLSLSETKLQIASDSTAVSSEESPSSIPADPNEIVEKVLLEVDPQIQQEWNWCAPATVSMMLSCRGVYVSQAQLAAEMGTEETFGTHNADAIRVLNKHLFGYEYPEDGAAGYRLAFVSSGAKDSDDMYLFLERLKQNIADGYPMYFTFDVSKIYPGLEGEHNVIGIGYSLTRAGEVADIYYLDSDSGQQDPFYGPWKTVTPEELLDAMTTCVEPNYGW